MKFKHFLFAVVLLNSSALQISSAAPADNQFLEKRAEVQKRLPSKAQEVQTELKKTRADFKNRVESITNIKAEKQTFENTIQAWNEMGKSLLVRMITFMHIPNLPMSNETKAESKKALQILQKDLYDTFQENSALYHTMISYINKAQKGEEKLQAVHWHTLQSFLDSMRLPECMLHKEKEFSTLKSSCSAFEKTSFTYLIGKAKDKALEKNKEITVLNLNTCLLPGDLPLLFGGVAPWKERTGKIAEKILSSQADIVCLQEVFTEEAGLDLYEKLKDRYAHFYVAIGPKVFGLSIKTLGLPSGLFVASKFAIDKPNFTPFSVTGMQINYGFFDFIVKDKAKPIAHIYNTHLQAYRQDLFPKIREQELEQILEKMHEDIYTSPKNEIPYFLCGDLNIGWGSGEGGERLIKAHFIDDYNYNRTKFSEEERTCTDYFIKCLFAPVSNPKQIPVDPQILDYALLLDSLPKQDKKNLSYNYKIKTKLLPMNDINSLEAISDHHGLLTAIDKN